MNRNQDQLSHPAKRFQGQFIDTLIAILLYFAGLYLIRLLKLESTAATIVAISVPIIYYVLSDALPGGQSIGKKLLGMAVVSKSTGKPCSILQSFIRNVFAPILGWIDAILIFGKKRQRLGDMMANTMVVDLGKPTSSANINIESM